MGWNSLNMEWDIGTQVLFVFLSNPHIYTILSIKTLFSQKKSFWRSKLITSYFSILSFNHLPLIIDILKFVFVIDSDMKLKALIAIPPPKKNLYSNLFPVLVEEIVEGRRKGFFNKESNSSKTCFIGRGNILCNNQNFNSIGLVLKNILFVEGWQEGNLGRCLRQPIWTSTWIYVI